MQTNGLKSSGLGINTDRIAVTSRQRHAQSSAASETNDDTAYRSAPFNREMPFTRDSAFVEVDGKKYYLDAPRGTYVNIVV